MLQPFVVGFVDHLLLANGGIVDDDIQIPVYVQCCLNDSLHIIEVFIVCHDTGDVIALVSNLLHRSVQLFFSPGGHDDFSAFFCEKLCSV